MTIIEEDTVKLTPVLVDKTEWDLAILNNFPNIQKTIRFAMGTVELKRYFERLMANDKRGETYRQGFPPDVFKALISLSLKNLELLEEKGLYKDNPVSDFAIINWDIPV